LRSRYNSRVARACRERLSSPSAMTVHDLLLLSRTVTEWEQIPTNCLPLQNGLVSRTDNFVEDQSQSQMTETASINCLFAFGREEKI